MICSAIARKAMKELVSKGLIDKVGEYSSSNPIYHGTKAKSKADDGDNKKGK